MRSIVIVISLAFASWLLAFQPFSARADEPGNQNSQHQSTYNTGNSGTRQQPKTSHNRTKATHKAKKYSHRHPRHYYHHYAWYRDYDRPYYYSDYYPYYYPYYGYDPYYYYGPGFSISTPFFGITIP
jgi:hypothetical protein